MANYTIPENPQYTTEIRKLENTDPASATAIFNPLVQAILNNIHHVKRKAEGKNAAIVALENAVAQNTSKINTLWDAVFNNITTNPFQISFADLSGITLSAGVWNAALQRLEC